MGYLRRSITAKEPPPTLLGGAELAITTPLFAKGFVFLTSREVSLNSKTSRKGFSCGGLMKGRRRVCRSDVVSGGHFDTEERTDDSLELVFPEGRVTVKSLFAAVILPAYSSIDFVVVGDTA